ncbi:oxidoreductase [Neorhizobium sp. SOG26]|uniref:Gfo/Idh/MocA family protein n=1 Tax=Neorhizobium sp. SOG26 TaxID=2060726 RepID=UPI000E571832|nr:Gfo/Idh/MocA family oxidoreductase [Neorhizobium sp. SOG26]AXV15250.1 oxidoreductase [Neorhizobium sp. SOG26]
MNQIVSQNTLSTITRPARLGFLGVGWIGRHRMEAILNSGVAEAVAIADASPETLGEAAKLAPSANVVSSLDELLQQDLDGIVIATPSAQHAEQSIKALESGVAAFCQKPLGRTAQEVDAVIAAARKADRLLGVDLSYRQTKGMQQIRELIRAGELGKVFAADVTFHNAYGPDKPWFYDKNLSGGGCVMDLGIHLIDLALWALDFPEITSVSSNVIAGGEPLGSSDKVEDYGVATLTLAGGTVIRLACSWRLQAGCDAIIEASFFGTDGGAAMRNVNGSFYDFTAERFRGTSRESLMEPPDDWGGRAAVAWARQLAEGGRYDPECERLADTARAMDQVYSNAARS